MTFLVLLARAAWAGIVAAGPRRFVPDSRILQLVARDEAPFAIFTFEQTLLAVTMLFSVLRILSFERDERLVVVDLFGLEDVKSSPLGSLGPLTNEVEVNFLSRVRMS